MADSIQQIITNIANSLGVNANLAIAIAQQESGLNPNAIGDNGNSVGLYQLNSNGEGAGLTVAQREDPSQNATIALKEVAAVAAQHPDWTPGQIAAAAQRPADQSGYAAAVNKLLGTPNTPTSPTAPAGSTKTGNSTTPANGTPNQAASSTTGSGSTVTVELGPNTAKTATTLADAGTSLGAGLSGVAGFVNKLQWFSLPTTWTRILCGIVGTVLLWVGLHHLAQEIKA